MKFKNYYKILELETNKVTIDQIKSAYRKQAKKYHPDVNVGDKLAEEKIKDVNEAYRILSNPSTKRKYDRTWNYNVGRRLNHTKTSGQMAGEIFGMFFGSGDTAESIDKPNEPAIRGEDIETEINISLEEGFYGANKTIVFKDLENKDKTITIKLPEGVQENEKIRLMGQGKTGKNGGKNGDMFIKINIEDSKKFKLDGINLSTIIRITPWEACDWSGRGNPGTFQSGKTRKSGIERSGTSDWFILIPWSYRCRKDRAFQSSCRSTLWQ